MPVRKRTTWVVVADGARARALENTGVGKGLDPSPILEMEVEPRPTRDLGSDRPGRVHDRFGPGRHAMQPKADWHRQDKADFLKSVAERLDSAAQDGAFDRLVLIAPPTAMGHLRAALNDKTRASIAGEITKDLTHASRSEIESQIGSVLAV